MISPSPTSGRPRGSVPRMIAGDDGRQALVRGSTLMSRAVCTSLGPFGSTVLSSRSGAETGVESLTGGGLIARRIVACCDNDFENMGAMLVRHAVCRVDREAGDATATTAAILDRLLAGLMRLINAGHDPVSIGHDLRACGAAALELVDEELLEVDSEQAARHVISEALHDEGFGELVSDALLAVGETGFVEVRRSRQTEPELEHVEGARWRRRRDQTNHTGLQEFKAARVAVTDDSIDSLDDLAALAAAHHRLGTQTLVVVCRSSTEDVRTRVANPTNGRQPRVVLLTPGETDEERTCALVDIAAFCGAEVASSVTGTRLGSPSTRLGAVRRGWLDESEFGLFSSGPSGELSTHLDQLDAERDAAGDQVEVDEVRRRTARLRGRTAILHVPTSSAVERDERLRRVQAALRNGHHALVGGVTAGGGSALVRVGAATARLGLSPAVSRAFASALDEPARRILRHSGFEPAVCLDRMRREAGTRIDARTGTWHDKDSASIVDTAFAVRKAIEVSISVASTVVLSEVLVRVRDAEMSLEP